VGRGIYQRGAQQNLGGHLQPEYVLQAPPGDPRCANPNDYETCFIPVETETQDDVLARLETSVANAPAGSTNPIVGFNYDPSRLGTCKICTPPPLSPSPCPQNGLGFACANFEDGNALQYLDALSTTIPIYIVSESGHIVYTNSIALQQQNICAPGTQPPGCNQPSINVTQEEKMAQFGQLNEDLAIAAETPLAVGNGSNPKAFVQIVTNAVTGYAQHGYTLVQEGSATSTQTALYEIATLDPKFPATAALLFYDPKVPAQEISKEVDEASVLRTTTAKNPNLIVAGPKVFADGSVQGLTAYFGGTGYLPGVTDDTLYAPSYGIWGQTYVGGQDFTELDMANTAALAHKAGFPLFIHQNGIAAIQAALSGMQTAGTVPGLRDLMIHFSMATTSEIALVHQVGLDVTFLMENLYFPGLPHCQQILGPSLTTALFPAASAEAAGLHSSLHPDTPVTPPYPLFAIWMARTRMTQQPTWYPNQTRELPGRDGTERVHQHCAGNQKLHHRWRL
jgi:predicted amidohydrolase YtcJ